MNALANSKKMGELEEFLTFGYSASQSPVRYDRYTGQEPDEKLVSGGAPLGKGEIAVRPDGDGKLSAAGRGSRRP